MDVESPLDGRMFSLVSSTASDVDPQSPTRFEYHEADGLVWGDYAGDTVSSGHFVGVRTAADRLEVTFAHTLTAGGAVTGSSASRIEPDEEHPGALRLIEEFEVDGTQHRSVCIEAPLLPD